MDQVSIKYTIISQNLPKFGFLVWKQTIWQPWFKSLTTISGGNGEKGQFYNYFFTKCCIILFRVGNSLTNLFGENIFRIENGRSWRIASLLFSYFLTSPSRLSLLANQSRMSAAASLATARVTRLGEFSHIWTFVHIGKFASFFGQCLYFSFKHKQRKLLS
jgi:hypothetical protein